MSTTQLSDLQLDRMLGFVSPPSPPAPDLADRIVARSARTPQARTRLLPIPRRHGPRRRPAVWSVAIAANLMAAAAAATSWDGRHFDFHRLVDLPHRVAAAIRIRHHRSGDQAAPHRERPHAAAQIASATPHAVDPRIAMMAKGQAPSLRAVAPIMPGKSQAVLHVRGTARVAKPHSPAAAGSRFRVVRPVLSRPAELRRQPIRRSEPVDVATRVTPPGEADVTRAAPRLSERWERRDASAQHGQPAVEASTSPKTPEILSQVPPRAEAREARQANLGRGRGRRWQNQWFRRMHPRQRGNRFRGRF